MRQKRWVAATVIAVLSIGPLTLGSAAAQPLDLSPIDCVGTVTEAEPGTPEFAMRDAVNVYCTEERRIDQVQHPLFGKTTPAPAGWRLTDPYRAPSRHHGVRFHYATTTISGIATEVYLPCSNDEGDCPDLPEGLDRFDPPYPAVSIHHGGASRKELHWWASQTLAEAGYAVVSLDSSSAAAGAAAVTWLTDPESPIVGGLIDTDRIGIGGHSAGATGASSNRQGDPRVSAILVWDTSGSGQTVSGDPDHVIPTLYLYTDGGFASPEPRTSVPGTVRAPGYAILRDRGVDSMVVNSRSTAHVEFTGGPLMGSRLAESLFNYFNLAWFDRYLKGRLVLDGTETPQQEAAERAYRQAVAQEAYHRLVVDVFDDSVDKHNISQGFWDPAQAATSLDPLYGGNVPYQVQGLPVADRLAFYFRSVCFVSVPDYVGGAGGGPGEPVAARADTTPEGDMRIDGCPEVAG